MGSRLAKAVVALAALSLAGLVVLAVVRAPGGDPAPAPARPEAASPAEAEAPPAGGGALALPTIVYLPGQHIHPSLSGLGSPEAYALTVLEVAPAGNGRPAGPAVPFGGDPPLAAPRAPGDYELRWLQPSGEGGALLASAAFKVSVGAKGAFKMTVPGEGPLPPGARFEVKVEEVPEAAIRDGAVVGLYRPGADGEGFLYLVAIDHPEEALPLEAPRDPGVYEARAFAAGQGLSPETLVEVVEIEVR
jgi:hypothetical protein